MRQIGIISALQHAAIFSEYLHLKGISNRVESSPRGFSIWVENEDDVASAIAEMQRYATNPAAADFAEASAIVQRGHYQHQITATASPDNAVDPNDGVEYESAAPGPNPYMQLLKKPAPITLLLLIGSILVAMLTRLGDSKYELDHPQVMNTLRIADFSEVTPQKLVLFQMLWNSQMNVGRELTEADITTMLHPNSLHIYKANFYSIQRGQVWRLFTPIFLHFNLLHILFNMMALIALGTAIEYRRGTWRFLLMVLIIAAGSNITQFIVSGPRFGGMSGVVYGLFGYMWIKGKYDPSFGMRLTSETITSMLLWLFLCMTPILGENIANSAHIAGLIIGIILAAISLPMKKQAVPETQV